MEALRIRGLTVVRGDRLACRGCGTCCSVYETLNMNVSDIFNMAVALGVGPETFFRQHCVRIEDAHGGVAFALDVKGGCKFRTDGKCSVYHSRMDTCALHPFDFPGVHLSQHVKAEVAAEEYDHCLIRDLPDDLIIVPDLERMVTGLILSMAKEAYLAAAGGDFDEATAALYHRTGQAQAANSRIREAMHRKLLNEMIRNAPVDPATKEPLLTPEEITVIYRHIRESAEPGSAETGECETGGI